MKNEEIVENTRRIESCVRKIFKNHENYLWSKKNTEKLPPLKYFIIWEVITVNIIWCYYLRILNNIEWYLNMNVLQFFSTYGKVLRMSDLLSRKQWVWKRALFYSCICINCFCRVETRINSSAGINFTEFSYQVFQAYDWYHLLDKHKCHIQVSNLFEQYLKFEFLLFWRIF